MDTINHNAPQLQLLSDEAFGEGGSDKTDGLGFETYAKVLSNAALNTQGPFTIGVFGEWGTGKTTLMRFIERNISSAPDTLTVWFNAWRYEKEEHPIVPLIATIVASLTENRTLMKRLKTHREKLLTALRAVAYGFSLKSKVKAPGIAEVEASFIAKDMIEREDKLARDPLLDKSLYHNAFRRLEETTKEADLRIVVLVDDLDRCMPDRAVALLESIKLVLCQRNFVFVMGVARSIIEGYLTHRYKIVYGLEGFQGHSYLDKIVQLPFYIPEHEDRMHGFSTHLLQSIEIEDSEAFKEILPVLGVACGGNPRTIIRFVNNLLIDSEICKMLAAQDKQFPVIPIAYFAITRALQQRWHDVFVLLITSNKLCERIGSILHTPSHDSDHSPQESDDAVVQEQIANDRQLKKLLSSKAGTEWLANHDVRSATRDFLSSQRRRTGSQYQEYEYDVYLSHATADKDVARRLMRVLQDEGLRVHYDEFAELSAAKSWKQMSNNEAVSSARTLVAIVSEESQKSEHCSRELSLMLKRDQNVIPVLLPGVDWDSVEPEELRALSALTIQPTGITRESILPLIRAIMHSEGSVWTV